MSSVRKVFSVMAFVLVAGLPSVSPAQLMNQAEPLPGITSSGQPSADQLSALAEQGYVAVIDLRGAEEDRGFEESATVRDLGMSYVSLPIVGADAINYDNAEALNEILAEVDGPVLIHCASSNRVGALLSLRQRLLGESADDALELGLEAGMSSPVLRQAVEERLAER